MLSSYSTFVGSTPSHRAKVFCADHHLFLKRHCFNDAYQRFRWIHVSKTKAALRKKPFVFTFGSLTTSEHNKHFKVNEFTKGFFIAWWHYLLNNK